MQTTAGLLSPTSSHSHTSAALVHSAGRWPGGLMSDHTRSAMRTASGDSLTSVPSQRWVLDAVVDTSVLSVVQQRCVEHGGFVLGAEYFDLLAFGVFPSRGGCDGSAAETASRAWEHCTAQVRVTSSSYVCCSLRFMACSRTPLTKSLSSASCFLMMMRNYLGLRQYACCSIVKGAQY